MLFCATFDVFRKSHWFCFIHQFHQWQIFVKSHLFPNRRLIVVWGFPSFLSFYHLRFCISLSNDLGKFNHRLFVVSSFNMYTLRHKMMHRCFLIQSVYTIYSVYMNDQWSTTNHSKIFYSTINLIKKSKLAPIFSKLKTEHFTTDSVVRTHVHIILLYMWI